MRVAEAIDLTTLLYRVRDEILGATPEGQRLTELYYSYIPNIAQVLIAHPELSDSSLETMNLFVPSLQALLDAEMEQQQQLRPNKRQVFNSSWMLWLSLAIRNCKP